MDDPQAEMRRSQDRLHAHMARAEAEKARKQERKWREALGKAVLEGRCDDAKRMALEHGDLAAADQASRLCVAAEQPAPAAPVGG
jgi:hypothetical protein